MTHWFAMRLIHKKNYEGIRLGKRFWLNDERNEWKEWKEIIKI